MDITILAAWGEFLGGIGVVLARTYKTVTSLKTELRVRFYAASIAMRSAGVRSTRLVRKRLIQVRNVRR